MGLLTFFCAVAFSTAAVRAAPPLFESEKIQLTQNELDALSPSTNTTALFSFGSLESPTATHRRCKVYPDDHDWPSEKSWAALNKITDGRLLKPRPAAAPCYAGPEYSGSECAALTATWTDSYSHLEDPIEMLASVNQGLTCQPPDVYDSKNCTMGGYPMYVINVTTTKHVQAGINFARNTGVRLVVKNTGHDFLGKSGGAASLSIWTHHFKEIQYIEEYVDEKQGYSGPAFKCGVGVQAFEINKAASEKGKMIVGGEGQTVGVMGGYIQGGGHSPLSSLYGAGADQVLAFEVVTADGRFVTADSTQNTDLFWALRGGGGGTFGVAISATVKAHPDVPTTTTQFTFTSANTTNDTFWAGVRAYFDILITNADAGIYSYAFVFPNNPSPGLFTFVLVSHFAPNKTLEQAHAILDPWFGRLTDLGIDFNPVITHYDSYYPAWQNSFPLDAVERANIATGSRMFPRANFEDPALLNTTFDTIRQSVETNHPLITFNMKVVSPDNPDNAVNSAWRQNILFALQSVEWSLNATTAEIWAARKSLTYGVMQQWRDISPGAGSYLSEADRIEPNFQQAFYGEDKYPRLLELKRKYDPEDVFWAVTAVGSESWEVESVDTLPNENGKLCQVNR